jgi:hypothetical protein
MNARDQMSIKGVELVVGHRPALDYLVKLGGEPVGLTVVRRRGRPLGLTPACHGARLSAASWRGRR